MTDIAERGYFVSVLAAQVPQRALTFSVVAFTHPLTLPMLSVDPYLRTITLSVSFGFSYVTKALSLLIWQTMPLWHLYGGVIKWQTRTLLTQL